MRDARPARIVRAVLETAIVLVFLLVALVPWEHWLGRRPDLARMGEGPSWAHPLGFDNLGRDLLVRIGDALSGAVLPLWGAILAGAVAGVALAFACTLGAQSQSRAARRAVSGLDGATAFVCALPVGVVAFAWAAWREEAGLFAVVASLTPLAAGLGYLRFRDLARRDATLAYWEAHRAAGGSPQGRLWRYGLRGVWRSALAGQLGLMLRVGVAVEAALSYLGFGVQEPQASFGNILASHFEQYLRGDWRVLAIVAAALALAAAFPTAALGTLGRLARPARAFATGARIAPAQRGETPAESALLQDVAAKRR